MLTALGSYFPETMNNEVAFFHAESKSLVEADLLLNLKAPVSVLTRMFEAQPH
jgi:hypothetical protein